MAPSEQSRFLAELDDWLIVVVVEKSWRSGEIFVLEGCEQSILHVGPCMYVLSLGISKLVEKGAHESTQKWTLVQVIDELERCSKGDDEQ